MSVFLCSSWKLSVLSPGNDLLLCWFVQVCVFFESLAECSLGFTYVCVAAVDVTRDKQPNDPAEI